MTGVQRDHGVHGQRPTPASLCCVLFAPSGRSVPAELEQSLRHRNATICLVADPYTALAELIERSRGAETDTHTVLLLLEPDDHFEACSELARAAMIYAQRVLLWQHRASANPRLSAFVVPRAVNKAAEAEAIEAVRASAQTRESTYDRLVREPAGPTLRLVVDEDLYNPRTDSAPSVSEDDDLDHQAAVLSEDELEMLMDPLFEPPSRTGGDQR